MSGPKLIALVGRPNVGKSSLFNALLGYRRSIVFDQPGTTRDLVVERAEWEGSGEVLLMDSQGVTSEEEKRLLGVAIERADAFLFVVEAAGSTPYDKEIARALHRTKKPVLLVVNKSDRAGSEPASAFASLGFDESVAVSTAHKRNFDFLRSWITQFSATPEKSSSIQLALIGRPNTGKSTIMNRLCGDDVSTVSPIAHTTRDPVAHHVSNFRLWDTAGVRRPRSTKDDIEQFSIHATTRTLKSADVVFLVLAAHEPITDQDMRLLNLIERSGKPMAVLLNFWDQVPARERRQYMENVEFARVLADYKRVPVSGKTGEGLPACLPLAQRLFDQSKKRVKTSRLNQLVRKIVTQNPPPSKGLGHFNILYASQVKVAPPTFVFFMNRKENLPASYQKYVSNKLQRELGFKSQNIRVIFR